MQMQPKQKTMGAMADVLKKLYAKELETQVPKGNGNRRYNRSDVSRPYILLGILMGILLAASIVTYNQMCIFREEVVSGMGRVDAELLRRSDLFDNQVELYMSYTKLEKDIFGHIAEVRSQLDATQKIMQEIKAQPAAQSKLADPVKGIDSTLSRLMAVVEQYPALKSFEPHNTLILNLVTTENRITAERGKLNTAIKQYNYTITTFPYKVLALVLGFKRFDYLVNSEEVKSAPKLKWQEFMDLRKETVAKP